MKALKSHDFEISYKIFLSVGSLDLVVGKIGVGEFTAMRFWRVWRICLWLNRFLLDEKIWWILVWWNAVHSPNFPAIRYWVIWSWYIFLKSIICGVDWSITFRSIIFKRKRTRQTDTDAYTNLHDTIVWLVLMRTVRRCYVIGVNNTLCQSR